VIAGVSYRLSGSLKVLTMGHNPWSSFPRLRDYLGVIDPMVPVDFLLNRTCFLRVDGLLSLARGDRDSVPRLDAFQTQFRRLFPDLTGPFAYFFDPVSGVPLDLRLAVRTAFDRVSEVLFQA